MGLTLSGLVDQMCGGGGCYCMAGVLILDICTEKLIESVLNNCIVMNFA